MSSLEILAPNQSGIKKDNLSEKKDLEMKGEISVQEIGAQFLDEKNANTMEELMERFESDLDFRVKLQVLNYAIYAPLFVIALEKFSDATNIKEKLIVLGISSLIGKLFKHNIQQNSSKINEIREDIKAIDLE